MRRFIIGFPVLVVLAGLAVAAAVAGTTGSAGADKKVSPTATKALQVRVITVTPLRSGTWDPAHYAAYNPVAKQMGWKLQIAELVPYGKAAEVMDRWGREKVDIVFSTDNGYERYLLDAARKYPNTLWVIMSDLSTTKGLKNVGAYGVDSCEEGLIEGAAAAALSKKGVIGADSPIPILPNKKELAGMRIGANMVRPGTKINVRYTGDFVDVVKAQEIASALVQQGADVLTGPTSGGTTIEIAKRAQQEGVPYVATNMDISRFAPKAVVTSIILDFSRGYREVAQQRLSGKFVPKIRRLGFKEGYIKVLPFRLGKKAEERKTKQVLNKLLAGKVNLSACQRLK